jgi:hypothetical protein
MTQGVHQAFHGRARGEFVQLIHATHQTTLPFASFRIDHNRVEWNESAVPAGIYPARTLAGPKDLTKNLLLTKTMRLRHNRPMPYSSLNERKTPIWR